MELKILLPFKVFAEVKGVERITVETSEGSFGILPRRLDCVAALVPGIMKYEKNEAIHYLAVDEGVLIKSGNEITISVRNVIGGVDLGELHEQVQQEFIIQDENEQKERDLMLKLESGFIQSFEKIRRQKR